MARTLAVPSPHRILVVDDDARLRKLLSRFLSDEGFRVDTVARAEEMDRQLEKERYDLMVLDVMMPGESGFSICRRLRGAGNDMSLIMLTAKGGDVDRIVGLEIGADDYVSKPFNPRELVARINAVLRRSPRGKGPAPKIVKFAHFTLNLANRALMRDRELIPLTAGEFAVLRVFALNPGQPLSREQLTESSRGREHADSDRTMDVQVSRLRKLLGDDPQRPRLIQTVWGYGYAFMPEVSKGR